MGGCSRGGYRVNIAWSIVCYVLNESGKGLGFLGCRPAWRWWQVLWHHMPPSFGRFEFVCASHVATFTPDYSLDFEKATSAQAASQMHSVLMLGLPQQRSWLMQIADAASYK